MLYSKVVQYKIANFHHQPKILEINLLCFDYNMKNVNWLEIPAPQSEQNKLNIYRTHRTKASSYAITPPDRCYLTKLIFLYTSIKSHEDVHKGDITLNKIFVSETWTKRWIGQSFHLFISPFYHRLCPPSMTKLCPVM